MGDMYDLTSLVPVRVLVALEPFMYREVLAATLFHRRPTAEVALARAEDLNDELDRFRPHLVVASEVPESVRDSEIFWMELNTESPGRARAEVCANGYSGSLENATMGDLLEVVERVAGKVASSGRGESR